ncbi:hypothetical protein NCCP2222_08510 [Sporosarcina sp. NCCP-2222]|uniref:hypothetical protein n=1 Tax=Sporosarcina sp. NCCP-2222 TaxID=2935073 RepID=UPI0020881996|nr:hypothetical protein [Sporosarcina sp. NCCP-2222]GKV54904.1 hypothetical protein NCCP2222_08510 [Sporosarcina sp. NCCP-2222]
MAMLFGIMLLVSACTKELSIQEVQPEKADPKVLESIQPATSESVQMLTDQQKGHYVVVYAYSPVTLSVNEEGTTLKIHIKSSEEDETEMVKRYIFKLTTNRDYDTIQLYRNAKEIPFDHITSY